MLKERGIPFALWLEKPPPKLPSPPITTINSRSIDWMMLNCSGDRNWILCAYNAPPRPARAADSANDSVL